MIDPRKFSRPNIVSPGQVDDRFFRFGLNDRDAMAAELRAFADAVENGTILLQSLQTGSLTGVDDFQTHAFMIEYVESEERARVPSDSKDLIAGDHRFPADIHNSGN